MIRPLRAAHRLIATGLVIAVPALLAGALFSRPAPPPPMAEVERHLEPLASGFGIGIVVSCCGQAVEVDAPDQALPEVLVYWAQPGAKAVDAHAQLLGTLTKPEEHFPLPPVQPDGSVLLYSPALGVVLERREFRKGIEQ